jgi:hypothetical protein
MPVSYERSPVEDSVAKVNNEVAVGSDLAFQRKWWRFERVIWVLFILIVLLDISGVFGRGPVADATLKAPDGSFTVKYEKIERFRTPSILSVVASPSSIHEGKFQIWLCQQYVDPLGNQRIIPQPIASVPENGGILYTFQMGDQPLGSKREEPTVQFALEPGKAGIFKLQIGDTFGSQVETSIIVMP